VANATILGVTYDPKRKVIYAGSRGGAPRKLVRIDASDPTKITPIADTEAGYNGITLAEDGSVFYTDQGGGKVYRVTYDGMKTMVASVGDANGIAFGPDGFLYVLSYGAGTVTRFKLANGMEMAGTREMFVKLPKGNADGIAFDKMGNMYVTSGALWKVTPDKMVTMVDAAGGANVEFGAGALSCKELLWASNPPHRKTIDAEGMVVPWHVP
jgi:sugar lactone lactonase YvrE